MTPPPGDGPLSIHAVVRNRRSERVLDALQTFGETAPYSLIEEGELAAVVSPAGHGGALADDPASEQEIQNHGRLVARLLRRSSVVPIPLGLTAEGEGGVKAFLARQRVSLLEALDYLEDAYELRLHLSAGESSDAENRLRAVAHHIYEQLQRQARSARILTESGGDRILSAAFLIPRGEWIRFVEQVADWEERYPSLRLDVTGPWAAWDFVHVLAGSEGAT